MLHKFFLCARRKKIVFNLQNILHVFQLRKRHVSYEKNKLQSKKYVFCAFGLIILQFPLTFFWHVSVLRTLVQWTKKFTLGSIIRNFVHCTYVQNRKWAGSHFSKQSYIARVPPDVF